MELTTDAPSGSLIIHEIEYSPVGSFIFWFKCQEIEEIEDYVRLVRDETMPCICWKGSYDSDPVIYDGGYIPDVAPGLSTFFLIHKHTNHYNFFKVGTDEQLCEYNMFCHTNESL